MWGGSKVPPSRPLRTGTRIGIGRATAGHPPEAGRSGPGGREEIQTARVAGRADHVGQGVDVSPLEPHREVQGGIFMGGSGHPDHSSRLDSEALPNEDLGEEGDRRSQSTPVIDRHRLHAGHGSGKCHGPVSAGADRAARAGRQIDSPMPSEAAGRRER